MVFCDCSGCNMSDDSCTCHTLSSSGGRGGDGDAGSHGARAIITAVSCCIP